MPTTEEKEGLVLKMVDIIDLHRRAGNAKAEASTLETVCERFANIAVTAYDNAEEAVSYLERHRFREFLSRYFELNHSFYLAFKSDPPGPVAVSTDVSFVHFAWLMEMFDEATVAAAIVSDEALWQYWPVRRIWADYHRMMDAFINAGHYEPNPPKPKGYEKHWLPYISLMYDFTKGQPTKESILQIDASFEKRNRDKRLADYSFIDGDGRCPVHWDLRKYTILEFATKAYGNP